MDVNLTTFIFVATDILRYEALFESSGPQPDFHRLEKFRPLETDGLLEGNTGAELSPVWKMALLEEKVSMIFCCEYLST